MRLYKVERRGGREGYAKAREWVGWARPGDPAPRRRIPNWVPICYEKYCKQCGFYECNQNPVQPVCEDCHAPHLQERPKSVDNPVLQKKREQEYRKLREEDNWKRGEGLSEEMITEVKDGRYKHMTPQEISEMMRIRRLKGKGTDKNRQSVTEEPLINLQVC